MPRSAGYVPTFTSAPASQQVFRSSCLAATTSLRRSRSTSINAPRPSPSLRTRSGALLPQLVLHVVLVDQLRLLDGLRCRVYERGEKIAICWLAPDLAQPCLERVVLLAHERRDAPVDLG